MKILIAEDDLVSRSFLSKFLSKYGECDLVVDGLETIDAFLIALKEGKPYQMICLDIMMPKVDGVKTLKAIRDLEKQYGVLPKKRSKIIMTTALAEAQLVRTAFEYGCQAYATKPIDTKKLLEVMEKLGLIGENIGPDKEESHLGAAPRKGTEAKAKPEETPYSLFFNGADNDEKGKNTPKRGMRKKESVLTMGDVANSADDGYFKNVCALPDHQIEVTMGTGTTIQFDFGTRLNTARFGMLMDEELFESVRTDGDYLIFDKAGRMPVKITASEFMDLVLIDRTK